MMKVLIADDDTLPRVVLQRQLEKWGYQVSAASDGVDAWERYQGGEFDIVITDWLMPRMDGLELIRRIRDASESKYTYSVLLTSKNATEDLVDGMDAGADDFLTKPFLPEELRVRLRAGERIVRLESSLAEKNRMLSQQNRELGELNTRLKRDLSSASSVQQSFLPDEVPSIDGYSFAWTFRPCEELAGDMLNIVQLDDDHVALFVLDVAGHGIAAALVSVAVNRVLVDPQDRRGLAAFSAAAMAERLNTRFADIENNRRFVTLVYGILDTSRRTLNYVTAGHPAPLHLPRNGSPNIPATIGIPIGVDEEFSYSERSLNLERGDRLVMYSDGLVEAANAEHEQFGMERLQSSLVAGQKSSLSDSVDSVVESALQWSGQQQFADDVSLLALEVL